ncbi:ankyrin [Polyplosphaeria fusca]|uniref:Ankyrin n=1 Tax=Polyplosphaeria fusca TaxID=682080 RepID=A0A9P4QXU9_9PLEO|nr:ankyrin [Polyplosphaeria fusca]
MAALASTSLPTSSDTSRTTRNSLELNEPPGAINESPTAPAPSIRPSVSWNSVRSRFSVSEKTSAQLGWAVAFLSVVITIVTLAPTFRAQASSDRALQLAEWTALKDYIEECREELAAGIQSQACLKAMKAKLPPPPDVGHGLFDTARRSLGEEMGHHNGTWRAAHQAYSVSNAVQKLSIVGVLLLACFFVFLMFENGRACLLRRTYTSKKRDEDIPTGPPSTVDSIAAMSTIRHPPPAIEATLRRRPVRTHPIYRHANLEEAIHHSDLAEIRTRLSNGEDVNKHWPYLIYSLAISPASMITSSRLEVARLCLDSGADVNALKGWNGQSALLIAIHFGNVAIAKLLLANGALVGYCPPDSNQTALHRCVRLAVTGSASDALEVMNMLFQYGANPNQIDRLGETPLHHLMTVAWFSRHDDAVMKKLYPVAQCLVEHGARMPTAIKQKYIVGNPLWEIVNSESWVGGWPESVEPGNQVVQVGDIWYKKEDVDAMRGLRSKRWEGEVKELGHWKYAFLDRDMTKVVKWPVGAEG